MFPLDKIRQIAYSQGITPPTEGIRACLELNTCGDPSKSIVPENRNETLH